MLYLVTVFVKEMLPNETQLCVIQGCPIQSIESE
jgi:hypothetical protein